MASPETSNRRRYTGLIAGLAIAVIVLCAAILLLSVRARRAQVARTDFPDPTANIQVIQPRVEVLEPPREFSWHPFSGAAQYRVRIADEDALWPMFVKTTTQPRLLLDAKEVAAITPGRIHEWDVEALDAKGHPIAKGGSRFRFMPPAGAAPGPPAAKPASEPSPPPPPR